MRRGKKVQAPKNVKSPETQTSKTQHLLNETLPEMTSLENSNDSPKKSLAPEILERSLDNENFNKKMKEEIYDSDQNWLDLMKATYPDKHPDYFLNLDSTGDWSDPGAEGSQNEADKQAGNAAHEPENDPKIGQEIDQNNNLVVKRNQSISNIKTEIMGIENSLKMEAVARKIKLEKSAEKPDLENTDKEATVEVLKELITPDLSPNLKLDLKQMVENLKQEVGTPVEVKLERILEPMPISRAPDQQTVSSVEATSREPEKVELPVEIPEEVSDKHVKSQVKIKQEITKQQDQAPTDFLENSVEKSTDSENLKIRIFNQPPASLDKSKKSGKKNRRISTAVKRQFEYSEDSSDAIASEPVKAKRELDFKPLKVS